MDVVTARGMAVSSIFRFISIEAACGALLSEDQGSRTGDLLPPTCPTRPPALLRYLSPAFFPWHRVSSGRWRQLGAISHCASSVLDDSYTPPLPEPTLAPPVSPFDESCMLVTGFKLPADAQTDIQVRVAEWCVWCVRCLSSGVVVRWCGVWCGVVWCGVTVCCLECSVVGARCAVEW